MPNHIKKLKTICCITRDPKTQDIMNIFIIVLLLAILLSHTDASRRTRRRRRARRAVACATAQPVHEAEILAKEELNIYSTDYVCYDNLKNEYPAMCNVLYMAKKKPNFVDTFKKYYMEKIYTKENFPHTYRPDAQIGNLDEQTLQRYYYNRCFIHASSPTIFMLFMVFPLIMIFMMACVKQR